MEIFEKWLNSYFDAEIDCPYCKEVKNETEDTNLGTDTI